MKKMYASPDIAFQTLNVNKQGTGTCEFLYADNPADSGTCALLDKGAGFIIFNTDACFKYDNGYPSDKEVCYGIPSESFNVQDS